MKNIYLSHHKVSVPSRDDFDKENILGRKAYEYSCIIPPRITYNLPSYVYVPSEWESGLDINAEGSNVSFQWYRNNQPIENNYLITGTNTNHIYMSKAGECDGEYYVVVSNVKATVKSNVVHFIGKEKV